MLNKLTDIIRIIIKNNYNELEFNLLCFWFFIFFCRIKAKTG